MKKILLFVVFYLSLQITLQAQTATNGDYRSAVTTGNWGTLATWEVRTAGAWATAAVLPTSSSNVYIQQGHTITVNIAGAVCQDLQLNFTSGILTLGANTLSVSGKLRSYTGTATTLPTGDGTFYSSQVDNSTSSATIITSTSGYLKFVGNSRAITTSNLVWGGGTTGVAVEFALNAGQTGTLATTFKAKEFIFSSGTITTTQRIAPDAGGSNSGILTIKNGATLSSNQSGTTAGNQFISRTGTTKCLQVDIQTGGTLELTGADPRMDVISFSNTGNVIYNKNGIQNLLQKSGNDASVATSYTNYYNLTIKTSGAKTIPAGYAIAIAAGGSFTENGDATCILANGGGSSFTYGAGATFFSSSTSNITLTAASLEWPAASSPDNVTVTASTLAFTPNLAAFTVLSYSLAGNIATINTTAAHGFTTGAVVTITNVFPCDTLFNGTYTLLSGSGTTFTYSLVSPYTIPLETATAPFGAVTNAPLTRTIPGILKLNGGGFNIGSGNKLIMANGSTVMRTSTLATSQFTVNSGFYSVGAAAGDLVNITINATGTVIGSSEMSSAPNPGAFGNLTVTNTAVYNTSGARKIINLINDGEIILAPTTTSTFTIYGNISGTGMLTSGNSNASITIGIAGTPSVGLNSGYAGILRFNQTTPGVTNAFNNFKSDRISSPAGTPTVTIANSVSFKGNYNQSNGIVDLASGTTLTLSGTVSSSTASLRGNNNASINITGTGALGNLYFDQTTPGTTNLFKDLTLNRTASGTATMNSDVIFGGTTTLTSGSLNIGSAVTLEIAGNFTNNSGSGTIGGAADNTTSNLPYLTISGAGATFNPLKFTTGFTEFKNFVANRSVSIDATSGNGLRLQGILNLNNASTTLTTNDNFTLRSTIIGSARILSLSSITTPFIGSFTVERYIPANTNRAWRLLSIPTSTTQSINQAWQNGQTPGVQGPVGAGTWVTSKAATAIANNYDAQSPNNYSLLSYNNATNVWDGVTASTTATNIATNGGYMLFVRGDRTATNIASTITATTLSTKGPLKTGTYPSTAITVNANKYEIIGNPYVSAIDLKNVTRTGGTDAIFYVWDPKILPYGAFQTLTFNGTNYIITPGGGNYGASGTIMDTVQSGQAFMAHATGSNGTIQFTEGSKIAGSRSVFRPATASSEQRLITNLYAINGTSIDLADGTMNQYDRSFSSAVNELDAKKLANFNTNLGMLRDGQILAVEKAAPVGVTDTIFYDLRKPLIKNYTLEFIASNLNHPNLLGKLEDTYLGTSTPVSLDGTTTYNFSVTSAAGSYASNRFRLVMYQSGAIPVNQLAVKATKQNKTVSIDWKAENQVNIQQYEVERSRDGISFISATAVAATGGNGENLSYNWMDENAVRGDNFYRIKSFGTSGEVAYSNIVKVKMGRSGHELMVYPNIITNRTINLQFTDEVKGIYTINMVSNSGQMLLSRQISYGGGSGVQSIPVDKAAGSGNYNLQVIKPDNRKTIIPLVIVD